MRLPLPSVRTDCFPVNRSEKLLPESVLLPKVRGWSLYQQHGTRLHNTNENLPFWCQGTLIPIWSRISGLSFSSHMVVPLRWTRIWLILETLVVILPFHVCETMTVILCFTLKAVKIVTNNQHLCMQEKNPKSYQFFGIVIMIIVIVVNIITIIIMQWILLF